jgi:hypothetical protein
MDHWLIEMRAEYNRDWSRRKLARYTLLLCAALGFVALVATRC